MDLWCTSSNLPYGPYKDVQLVHLYMDLWYLDVIYTMTPIVSIVIDYNRSP